MRRSWVILTIAVLCACGEDDTTSGPASITVHMGESIQAAVDAAPPHAKIVVESGVYHESAGQPTAITVTKDGIDLVAATPGSVVLENAGGQTNGIWVSPADSLNPTDGEHPPCGENGNLIHGFTLTGFTVRGFGNYGVYLSCVDGFTLAQNLADSNQVYGLFPVRSHNGTMNGNEAQNTPLDSALYVGQSDHVVLTNNSAHDNVQGLEVENSSDITVTGNQIFNNTAGIIADIMPGLQKKDQTNVTIANNTVRDNNRPNPNGPDTSTSSTPPGTGIVVLGGSAVTVQSNTVSNNGFAGIIVAGFCSGPSSSAQQCTNLDIDPNPENAHILNNNVSDNGMGTTNPLLARLAADLIWDKSGAGNCWAGNTPTATIKLLGPGQGLPVCQ